MYCCGTGSCEAFLVSPAASSVIRQRRHRNEYRIVTAGTDRFRPPQLNQLSSSTPLCNKRGLAMFTGQDDAAFVVLAATEVWVQPLSSILGPLLNFMSLAMLSRVVLSWYPETKLTKFPWIILVFPTEPFLKMAKGVVPPAFGVDITPVVWLALFTFMSEIFLGQQGLLTMKIKYGI
jgi:YggT family protein